MGEEIDDTFANYGQTNTGAYGFTPVGNYPKGVSPYGAYDMAGNAWEWVADSFDGYYYESSPASNPLGPPDGEYGTPGKVIWGGSWDNGASDLRTAKRIWECPNCIRNGGIGFRCARSQSS